MILSTVVLSEIPTAITYAVPETGAGKTVIVLDPGHSGSSIQGRDQATGLLDSDYPNTPEITEVFDVATKVKTKLEADGYEVVMTKNSANDTVSLRRRADIANQHNAALAVSIHNDHGQSWSSFAQIYVQRVGQHRDTDSGNQVKFTDSAVAEKSQRYGDVFARERTSAEGHSARVNDISFNGRGLAPGNIPLVELFARVPWVYNEVGASGGLSPDQINKYADGLAKSIEQAVPSTGAGETTNGSNCVITKVGNPQTPKPTLPPECQANAGEGGSLVGTALQMAVIKLAREHLNGTYVWGSPSRDWKSSDPSKGKAPQHFDCSGFAGWVWYWASGGKVNMAGQTDADWLSNSNKYQKVVTKDKSKLQPGDLVYFGSASSTHHVGIYEGTGNCGANDCFLEYYHSGAPGRENSLSKEPDFVGFLRPVIK